MIRTLRPLDRPDPGLERVAKANGFSLHAGVSCEGHQKDKRERLCRYIVSALKSTSLTLFVCRRTVSQSALLLVLDFHIPGQ